MKPFDFAEPTTLAEAAVLLTDGHGASRVIAGGSDLLGELKEGTAHAGRLVSLARIPALREVRHEVAGLRIGAGLTLAELEAHPFLLGPWRMLAEAARGVATPEIRNQGTLGGNLCQRPRCLHYRSPWLTCFKRGGTDCPAATSEHQAYLSVFGGGRCVAVNASDLAPPLIALDAHVVVHSPTGERRLPLGEFFSASATDATREHVLAADEIVSAIVLPPIHPELRGTFLKSRERTAGDFPLVSLALRARLAEGRLTHVRLVLGGVAPVPRPCPEAAALLEGQAPSPEAAAHAADAAFAGAAPLPHNAYKVDLGRALIARAVRELGAG